MFSDIFFAFCTLLILVLIFGETHKEIRFYRLMTDKKKYWRECFPRYLKSLKREMLIVAIGLVLIIAFGLMFPSHSID